MCLARFLLASLICLTLTPVLASTATGVLEAAEQHARTQSKGLPGEIGIRAGPLDPSTQMPPCRSLQAYTPAGARPWGRTHVGVRCLAPSPWNVLVPVQITVTHDYLVTSRALVAGQTLQPGDVVAIRGDLSALPAGVVTDPATILGKTLKNSLGAGQPLRSDLLLAPLLVRQGQNVRIVSRGPGFSVSREGKALNNASVGQVAQVRVSSGQTISGIVLHDGSIEISP